MPTYVALVNFTDQGIRNVKQTTERAKAMSAAAAKLGIKVKDTYWTMGQYDAVLVADAPNDEAITTWTLSGGSLGNIRTQTMRAYSAEEMNKIVAKLP
ncbi:MAG: GYD domain-containing protein [Candidatus Binatia bacterium]